MTAPSKRSLWIGAALLALLAVVLYRRLGLGDLLTLELHIIVSKFSGRQALLSDCI